MAESFALAPLSSFPENHGRGSRYSHTRPTGESLYSMPGMSVDADGVGLGALDINPVETSRYPSFVPHFPPTNITPVETSQHLSFVPPLPPTNINPVETSQHPSFVPPLPPTNIDPVQTSQHPSFVPPLPPTNINPVETSQHPSFLPLPSIGSSWQMYNWEDPTGSWLKSIPVAESMGSYFVPEGGRLTFGSVLNDRPAESNLMSAPASCNSRTVRFVNPLVSSEFVFPREGHASRPLSQLSSVLLSQYSFVPPSSSVERPTGDSQVLISSWTPPDNENSRGFRRSGSSPQTRRYRGSFGGQAFASGWDAANRGTTQSKHATLRRGLSRIRRWSSRTAKA